MPPFNEFQLRAIATRLGPIVICAVPGAGKTTVFGARSQQILAEERDPESALLGLTFTKSAAESLEKRAKYKSGDGKPKIFRTFHGWALNFCTQNYDKFSFSLHRHPLILPHEQWKVMGPILKSSQRRVKYKEVMYYISAQKRHDVGPLDAAEKAENEIQSIYAGIYGRYELACRNLGKLDFDSMMVEAVKLMERHPALGRAYAPKYLQCDEAQDNDRIQWKLIQILGQARGNVFCVGDPEQNMYTWRGSEADGLKQRFAERFPGAVNLPLPINYRSTGAIIEFLKEISPAWREMDMRSAKGYGVKPSFRRYIDEGAEAETILAGLKDAENTAILARTNRQLSAFEKAAGAKGMKYKLLGKSGFFTQHEVESTIAFARYCVGGDTDDVVKKILKSPYDDCRFIKKQEAIDGLEAMKRGTVGTSKMSELALRFRCGEATQEHYVRSLFQKLNATKQAIRGKSSQDALRHIISNFGILRHYEDDEDAIDNGPADNVLSLLRMAEKRGSLLDFVQMCHKAKAAARSNQARLTFSTIHQAKGLEWKYVYVVGVNADVLPHKDGDPEEEARIYRVACSRAADFLEISCNEVPSPFIEKVCGRAVGVQQAEVDLLEVMYRNAAEGSAA